MLQSRLDPHMVSNTLAGLSALIALDSAAAQKMVAQFAGYLRNVVGSSSSGVRTLEDEFAAVGDFLGLMKVRMGERLDCFVSLADSARCTIIPAGIVQVLVENAITHGLEQVCGPGSLRVEATREADGYVLVRVSNSGKGIAPDRAQHEGNGLRYLRRRLLEAFGEAATFHLRGLEDGSGVSAEVRFPGTTLGGRR